MEHLGHIFNLKIKLSECHSATETSVYTECNGVYARLPVADLGGGGGGGAGPPPPPVQPYNFISLLGHTLTTCLTWMGGRPPPAPPLLNVLRKKKKNKRKKREKRGRKRREEEKKGARF